MDKIKHPGLVGFATFLAFLAVGCNIGAIATPYWLYQSSSGSKAYGGFWTTCAELASNKMCVDSKPWDEGLEWYERTTPGLLAGAALLTFIGFIIVLVKSCKGSDPGCQNACLMSGILFVVGALMIGGALFVWGWYQSDLYKENKGYSFYTACAGGGLFLITAVLLALPVYKENNVYPF